MSVRVGEVKVWDLVRHSVDKDGSVDSESFLYKKMYERWHLPMTLGLGTLGMRRAREKYLPREPGESVEGYTVRLNRSFLFEAYTDTLRHLAGKPYSRDVIVKEGSPQPVFDWQENVDLEGTNLTMFAQKVLYMALDRGLTHVLIDFPVSNNNLTLGEERRQNLRPYLVHVPPENVIAWRSTRYKGEEVLTHLRIRERAVLPSGRYGEKEVERIRVFDRTLPGVRRSRRDREGILREDPGSTTWQLFEKSDSGEWIKIDSGVVSINRIPLRTYYTRREGFMVGYPLLEGMAWKNLEHWQSASDQRHILHVARVPILFGSGLTEEDLKDEDGNKVAIGPNSFLVARDPSAQLKYVEHTGAAIASGRSDLKDIIEHMVVLGMRPVIERPSPTPATATESAIQAADSTSDLKAMVRSEERFLEACFDDALEYIQQGPGTLIDIYDEFALFSDAEIQELGKSVERGFLSPQSYWRELVRRGVLAPAFDIAAEMTDLEAWQKKQDQRNMDKMKAAEPPKEG